MREIWLTGEVKNDWKKREEREKEKTTKGWRRREFGSDMDVEGSSSFFLVLYLQFFSF